MFRFCCSNTTADRATDAVVVEHVSQPRMGLNLPATEDAEDMVERRPEVAVAEKTPKESAVREGPEVVAESFEAAAVAEDEPLAYESTADTVTAAPEVAGAAAAPADASAEVQPVAAAEEVEAEQLSEPLGEFDTAVATEAPKPMLPAESLGTAARAPAGSSAGSQDRPRSSSREVKMSEADKKRVEDFLKAHGYSEVNVRRTRFWKYKYALHTAVKENNVELVKLLLKAGADRRKKNSDGQTAKGFAQSVDKNGSHAAVIAALRSRRKRESKDKADGAQQQGALGVSQPPGEDH
eukprot:TRINITY_DN8346_c0_g1_i2.p1 TRINITY_DN8346_c0_g1~~TRINITY_DN8346_c0_g1_i2.p1  ORF type:complete len:295 (-),score=78.62 TRINITY_DN8346_c0_g1_i2:195-1079(-)